MAKNVLIVDDAAFMRMMIKDILSKNGYSVVAEAENGKIAVDKYNEVKPDLVLMDITMPEMDGIQALKAIKGNDANASIIMLPPYFIKLCYLLSPFNIVFLLEYHRIKKM